MNVDHINTLSWKHIYNGGGPDLIGGVLRINEGIPPDETGFIENNIYMADLFEEVDLKRDSISPNPI